MLRIRFNSGELSIHLNFRAIAPAIGPVLRGAAVFLLDAVTWGMHPASPYQPIVLRNRIARGRA